MMQRLMNMTHDCLLVFMRYPREGKVKSRLACGVGAREALRVYEKLLRRTLGVAAQFKHAHPEVRIVLCHMPDDPAERLRERFPGPWEFRPQAGEHLGTRMQDAMCAAFAGGSRKAVLIGTDIADIETGDIAEAFANTGGGTATLGAASDGGFYLIGLDRPCEAPFGFEHWGSGMICARTARALGSSGLRVHYVRMRTDIDRPEDLSLLVGDFLFHASVSVIVPTLKSPENLAPLLDYLQNALWPGDEIILVQGGFASFELRELHPSARHLLCPPGRGLQQNAGAMLAEGNILFFLHDDTIPPPHFPFLIRQSCRDPRTALGCFRLAFAPGTHLLTLVAGWANLRTALFKLPYGDQALFCRKDVFELAGGFRNKYILEESGFVRRCGNLGRLDMLPVSVHSSSERYLKKGVISASLQNHTIILLSALGLDEKYLYSLYYGRSPERISTGR